MSNETLDEARRRRQVRRARRPGARLPHADRRQPSTTCPACRRSARRPPPSGCRSTAALDAIVAHAGEIGGVVGENLRAALDWLPQGRRLLTVKTDCALPVAPADLAPSPPRDAALARAVRALRIQELAARPRGRRRRRPIPPARSPPRRRARPGGVRARRSAGARARKHPPRHYETVLDEAAFERWRHALAAAELVCFDTETTSLDPLTAQIVGLSFCVEPGHACYIPLGASLHRRAGAARPRPRCSRASRRGSPIRRRAKLGQNVKYDQHVLANHGVALAGVAHDTLLESYVLESHKPHDMDNLAWRHLDVQDDQLRRRRRQGRDRRSASTRCRVETRHRVLGRGRRRHAAAAPRAAPAPGGGPAARCTSTRRSRCRCARCCSGWSAPAC